MRVLLTFLLLLFVRFALSWLIGRLVDHPFVLLRLICISN